MSLKASIIATPLKSHINTQHAAIINAQVYCYTIGIVEPIWFQQTLTLYIWNNEYSGSSGGGGGAIHVATGPHISANVMSCPNNSCH